MMNQQTAGQPPRLVGKLEEWAETAKGVFSEIEDAVRFLFREGAVRTWQRVQEEGRLVFGKLTGTDYLLFGLGATAFLFGALVFASGVAVLGWQSFVWLQEGAWNALPMMAVFEFFLEGTPLHQWLLDPQSWMGLHQLIHWSLENIPVSLVLIIDGIGFMAGVASVMLFGILVRRYQIAHS